MSAIDLTPLYRSSVGFDRLASLIDNAFRTESVSTGYPPYNIEMDSENNYYITLAVAGFLKHELDIHVEKGVLTIRGEKQASQDRTFLHQGIAFRTFERKFNLADHVEVVGADLNNGLLTVNLVKEIPEAMKPKRIDIQGADDVLENDIGKKSKQTEKVEAVA